MAAIVDESCGGTTDIEIEPGTVSTIESPSMHWRSHNSTLDACGESSADKDGKAQTQICSLGKEFYPRHVPGPGAQKGRQREQISKGSEGSKREQKGAWKRGGPGKGSSFGASLLLPE